MKKWVKTNEWFEVNIGFRHNEKFNVDFEHKTLIKDNKMACQIWKMSDYEDIFNSPQLSKHYFSTEKINDVVKCNYTDTSWENYVGFFYELEISFLSFTWEHIKREELGYGLSEDLDLEEHDPNGDEPLQIADYQESKYIVIFENSEENKKIKFTFNMEWWDWSLVTVIISTYSEEYWNESQIANLDINNFLKLNQFSDNPKESNEKKLFKTISKFNLEILKALDWIFLLLEN